MHLFLWQKFWNLIMSRLQYTFDHVYGRWQSYIVNFLLTSMSTCWVLNWSVTPGASSSITWTQWRNVSYITVGFSHQTFNVLPQIKCYEIHNTLNGNMSPTCTVNTCTGWLCSFTSLFFGNFNTASSNSFTRWTSAWLKVEASLKICKWSEDHSWAPEHPNVKKQINKIYKVKWNARNKI